MKELNLGLSRKHDIGKDLQMELKTHGATLKEINNLRQEDTRENRKLAKTQQLREKAMILKKYIS